MNVRHYLRDILIQTWTTATLEQIILVINQIHAQILVL